MTRQEIEDNVAKLVHTLKDLRRARDLNFPLFAQDECPLKFLEEDWDDELDAYADHRELSRMIFGIGCNWWHCEFCGKREEDIEWESK